MVSQQTVNLTKGVMASGVIVYIGWVLLQKATPSADQVYKVTFPFLPPSLSLASSI